MNALIRAVQNTPQPVVIQTQPAPAPPATPQPWWPQPFSHTICQTSQQADSGMLINITGSVDADELRACL